MQEFRLIKLEAKQIKKIIGSIGYTQIRFAREFHIEYSRLKGWLLHSQYKRPCEKTAALWLRAIEMNPAFCKQVIESFKESEIIDDK